MSLGWASYPALALVGLAAGTLNVIAGGGSFVTLPVMIFLGLPPTVANGTNRIAILVQDVAAVWGFERRKLVPWRWTVRAGLPAVVGALLGSWVAVHIGDASFRRILSLLMVVVSLASLWRPGSRKARKGAGSPDEGGADATMDPPDGAPAPPDGLAARFALGAGFFAVGVYGGFVQAGTGLLFLAVALWADFDLVRGNALKVLIILLWTPVSLFLFAASAKVDWGAGLALAVGNLVGALAGVHLTVLKGHRWVRRVVTGTVIVFAVALWLLP